MWISKIHLIIGRTGYDKAETDRDARQWETRLLTTRKAGERCGRLTTRTPMAALAGRH
ncbi:hypothetical protein ABIE67_000025 [Streptomyces sp. V4I8]